MTTAQSWTHRNCTRHLLGMGLVVHPSHSLAVWVVASTPKLQTWAPTSRERTNGVWMRMILATQHALLTMSVTMWGMLPAWVPTCSVPLQSPPVPPLSLRVPAGRPGLPTTVSDDVPGHDQLYWHCDW